MRRMLDMLHDLRTSNQLPSSNLLTCLFGQVWPIPLPLTNFL